MIAGIVMATEMIDAAPDPHTIAAQALRDTTTETHTPQAGTTGPESAKTATVDEMVAMIEDGIETGATEAAIAIEVIGIGGMPDAETMIEEEGAAATRSKDGGMTDADLVEDVKIEVIEVQHKRTETSLQCSSAVEGRAQVHLQRRRNPRRISLILCLLPSARGD